MRRRLGRKGQSIVEYLIIVALVIGAIATIRATVQANMDSLFQGAAGQTKTAAGALGGLAPE